MPFYYRPIFLETQEKTPKFFRKIYYVKILCKQYYVYLMNQSDRGAKETQDIVVKQPLASKCGDRGCFTIFVRFLGKKLTSLPNQRR